MLKRAHKSTFHKISPKHLQRYVAEFAGRRNIRDKDTIDQMTSVVAGMVGRRLLYRELVAGEREVPAGNGRNARAVRSGAPAPSL